MSLEDEIKQNEMKNKTRFDYTTKVKQYKLEETTYSI